MIGKKGLNNLKQKTNIIFKSRFLQHLTPIERFEFLQLCHRRKYKEGEYIYYQNDPGTGMYFIEDGRVQLVVVNNLEDGETGKVTHEINPPESFGALSIGYELRRMSSAKCLTDCTLLGFFKPDFETLKKRHPDIAVKFMETLSMIAMRQLEKTTRKLIEATDIQQAFALQFAMYLNPEEEETK
jgi:CRP-like cAMP-binding protein